MARLTGIRVIPDAKLTRYLLNKDHPEGRSKAEFFASFGFDPKDPQLLATALMLHADAHPVYAELAHGRGVNRVGRCNMITPDGRNPCIVAVWVQKTGTSSPRLVTAYPA